jgi:signal transduction histidine kinase
VLWSYRSAMTYGRRAQLLDLSIAMFVTVVTTVLAWSDNAFFGDPLAGPLWAGAVLPLLLGLPLLVRRTRPLLTCCLVWGGIAWFCTVSRVAPEGLECVVAFFVSSYSVAAYSSRRTALLGLGVIVSGYVIYTAFTPNITVVAGDQWASAFFATMTLACWLLGFSLHSRRSEVALAQRAAALERASVEAVRDERGRIARELHDIVSHRLSVVVVQAAGARAQAPQSASTLEKIEDQAREALNEMRTMLGLLRDEDDLAEVAPQPGLSDVPGLVASVCSAGLPVELAMSGDITHVPRAVELSAYRIVQESLTNALRHSGARHGRVTVHVGPDRVEVAVADDGHGMAGEPAAGHGLAGMRERAQLLGGELQVESSASGLVVRASLPT